MTVNQFYKTKFTPAYTVYLNSMKANGELAVQCSSFIHAAAEFDGWLKTYPNEDANYSALDKVEGSDLLAEFLCWYDDDDYSASIFLPTEDGIESFNRFFTQFVEDNA